MRHGSRSICMSLGCGQGVNGARVCYWTTDLLERASDNRRCHHDTTYHPHQGYVMAMDSVVGESPHDI